MLEVAEIFRLYGAVYRACCGDRLAPAQSRAHPKQLYALLLRCAAAARQKLCHDPRHLGARVGCLAVLHTWTRAMLFHPHVHLLVTAGGLSPDQARWIPTKELELSGTGEGPLGPLPRQDVCGL
jgi:hypothetical protein